VLRMIDGVLQMLVGEPSFDVTTTRSGLRRRIRKVDDTNSLLGTGVDSSRTLSLARRSGVLLL
jgi:hypothetical protein